MAENQGFLERTGAWLKGLFSAQPDRRAEQRNPTKGQATVRWENERGSNTEQIDLIDVSAGGVRFRSKYRFPIDQELQIEDGKGHSGQAVVRHCQVAGMDFEIGASADWS